MVSANSIVTFRNSVSLLMNVTVRQLVLMARLLTSLEPLEILLLPKPSRSEHSSSIAPSKWKSGPMKPSKL